MAIVPRCVSLHARRSLRREVRCSNKRFYYEERRLEKQSISLARVRGGEHEGTSVETVCSPPSISSNSKAFVSKVSDVIGRAVDCCFALTLAVGRSQGGVVHGFARWLVLLID